MTTVVWRAGVIAADRLMDDWQEAGKLFRLKSGAVLSGAGNYDDIVEVARWFDGGAKEDDKPVLVADEDKGTDFIVAMPDGTACWLTSPFLRLVKINEPYAAIGSGKSFALAAFAMGARPKRAIEVARMFDPNTGKGIDVIRVKKA